MTIFDIRYIGLIIFIILVYIGSAMYMLQLNVGFGDESDIIEPTFDLSIIDATLNQYMLVLGEFNMDGFKNHVNNGICYMIFLGSTFITQITFLNMLIAIMGDTFDRVISQRPTYSLKNKLKLMADMKSIINIMSRKKKEDETKVFLYVIQPVQDEDEVSEDRNLSRGKSITFRTKSRSNSKTSQNSSMRRLINKLI